MATTDAVTSDDDGVPNQDYMYSGQQFVYANRSDTPFSGILERRMTQTMSGPERLRFAASKGDCETVADLICQGIPLESDKDGKHPIHLAALNGHIQIVRMILDTGVDVDVKDNTGYTTLHKAASQGHREVIQLLIMKGADPNQQDTVHGNSPLHDSAWNGYSGSVDILCQSGTYINIINKSNFTALHLASQSGHNQSARVLLYAGCDPNAKNNYGDTSLHTASRYGHAGVTRILLSARARVSEVNKNWDTALHIAAALKRRKIAKLLVEAGADLAIQNLQSETPLEVARRKGHDEIFSILISRFNDDSGAQFVQPQPLSAQKHRVHTFDSIAAFNTAVNAGGGGAGNVTPARHAAQPRNGFPVQQSHYNVPAGVHVARQHHQVHFQPMTTSVPGPRRAGDPDEGGTPSPPATNKEQPDTVGEDAADGDAEPTGTDGVKKRPRKKSFFFLFRKKKVEGTPTAQSETKQQGYQSSALLNDQTNTFNQSMRPKQRQQQHRLSSNQNLTSNTSQSRHVPGLLSHYNAYNGTQYYRDLAGNVKESKGQQYHSYPHLPLQEGDDLDAFPQPESVHASHKQLVGPIGYAPVSHTCTCLDRQYWNSAAPPGHTCRGDVPPGHFMMPAMGPCMDHGYAEYHGPLNRRQFCQEEVQRTTPYKQPYDNRIPALPHPSLSTSVHRPYHRDASQPPPRSYQDPSRQVPSMVDKGRQMASQFGAMQQAHLENLPANAPITSMFPASDPSQGTRLFRSRSDESLNMSEHKQRSREERMRQQAVKEMRMYNQLGDSSRPESPVKGRRELSAVAPAAPGGPGLGVVVPAAEEARAGKNSFQQPSAGYGPSRIAIDSAQKPRRNSPHDMQYHPHTLEQCAEFVRPSPDGQQTDACGETALTSSAATTTSLGYHSGTSGPSNGSILFGSRNKPVNNLRPSAESNRWSNNNGSLQTMFPKVSKSPNVAAGLLYPERQAGRSTPSLSQAANQQKPCVPPRSMVTPVPSSRTHIDLTQNQKESTIVSFGTDV